VLGFASTPEKHLRGREQKMNPMIAQQWRRQCPTNWLLLVGVILIGVLVGCNRAPRPTDSRAVMLQPGRGMTNACEIGMTTKQVARMFGDTSFHGINDDAGLSNRGIESRFMLIPALGAIAVFDEHDQISHLNFHTRNYRHPVITGLVIGAPFRGRLGANLDFGTGRVTRAEVEAAFGNLERGSTNAADYGAMRMAREPFWINAASGGEELWYEKNGVTFNLRSNEVVAFSIYRPLPEPTGEGAARETQLK
jgi:hypothetical protein